MKRLIVFFILVFSNPLFAAPECGGFFSDGDPTWNYKNLDEFLKKSEVQARLMEKVKRDSRLANFVMQLISHQDYLFYKGIADAAEGKFDHINPRDLGYKDADEAQYLKDQVIMRQFTLLSMIGPRDLTEKLQNTFMAVSNDIFNTHTPKSAVMGMIEVLNDIIREYN